MNTWASITQFASLHFAIFFLIVFSGCWLVGQRTKYRNTLLLAFSYLFYAQLGMVPITLLLCSTLFNYSFGNGIVASRKADKIKWLWSGVGFNLGILGTFKYYDFFRDSLEDIAFFFGLNAHLPFLHIALPIGISFYTFQALTYLIDLYRGHGIRARSLLDFALYLAFFPQLLIGPICRSKDLLPQIQRPPPRNVPDVPKALMLIISGLFKKAIIATLLAEHGVADAFEYPESFSAIGLWGGMIGYSIQLYCDFSGYTDMARGYAMLLGFYLPDNFKSPYIATNIGEFWQRWHITFSQWLRDYIYIPLGGSRRNKWRVSLNLFLTFLFCGLWHGATWGYVIWGALHGVALAIHKRNRDRKRAKGIDPTIKNRDHWQFIGWCYTFGFVCMSRIVFYAPDLQTAFVYYRRMFTPNAIGLGAEYTLIVGILIGLLLNFVGPTIFRLLHERLINMQTVYRQVSTSPVRSTIMGFAFTFITLFLLLGSLIGILLLRPGDVAFYLYFRF